MVGVGEMDGDDVLGEGRDPGLKSNADVRGPRGAARQAPNFSSGRAPRADLDPLCHATRDFASRDAIAHAARDPPPGVVY